VVAAKTHEDHGDRLTVAELADDSLLRLRILVAGGALDQRIHSTHTTDLAHPFRYLLPGELVLTNGLWVGQIEPEEWVEELIAAGVTALGFGLSELHDAVPAELVEVCREAELPLFEVPADLSFSRIAEHVAGRTPVGGEQVMRGQLGRTRELVRALLQGQGYKGLLQVLERETELAGAFVSPCGEIYAHVGAPPDKQMLQAALAARRTQHLPRSLGPELSVFAPPIRGAAPFMLLVRRSMRDLSDEELVLIEQIAAYATAEDDLRRHAVAVRRELAGELVRLAVEGELTDAAYRARLKALELDPRAPVLVAVSAPSAFVVGAIDSSGRAMIAATADTDVVVLAQGFDPAAFRAWLDAEQISSLQADLAIGVGGIATNPDTLRARLVTARASLERALGLPPGERVVEQPSLDSIQLVNGFVSAGIAQTFRDQILGPLEAWDEQHGTDLVETARVFLEHDGRWRETARVLYIHHNTLKNRIERIRLLTGRDADKTADCADLWLALVLRQPT